MILLLLIIVECCVTNKIEFELDLRCSHLSALKFLWILLSVRCEYSAPQPRNLGFKYLINISRIFFS